MLTLANAPAKIIIAIHHFPPNFIGGSEWRAHRTAQWLQARGHTVKVVCIESITDTQTDRLRWVDETFRSVWVRRLYLNLTNAPDPVRWEFANPWLGEHFAQFLAAEQPDLLHLFSGYLMTSAVIGAAKNLDIPVVTSLTDFWFLCPRHTLLRTTGQVCAGNTPLDCVRCKFEEKRRYRIPAQKMPDLVNTTWQLARFSPYVAEHVSKIEERGEVLRKSLGEVDVAICPSNFLKNMYLTRGYSAKQMFFLRQGVRHIPPAEPPDAPSSVLRVGYIGQIARHKGVLVLLEAFKKLGNLYPVHLTLYGDVNQFPDFYKSLPATDPEKIKFHPRFDHTQISEVFKTIDVLVVPSTWYENSPNVILEAFAHHTPVIASNLGGMAELVDHEKTGLLFTPGSSDELAGQLRLLCEQPQKLLEFKQNIVAPYLLEEEMNQLLQLYGSVLT